jgi:hypothetical protein
MEVVEWTNIKYIHSKHTLKINLNQLNQLKYNNEKQDCKISTVCGRVLAGGGGGTKEIK